MINESQLAMQELADARSKTAEPFHTMIDPNLQALIMKLSTKTAKMTDNNGKVILDGNGQEVYETIVTRGDIYNFYIELSHLVRTANLDEGKARSFWFEQKRLLRRCKAKYRSNPEIMDLINKLRAHIYAMVFGDMQNGKRQKFLSTQNKNISISQPGMNQNSGPWWSR